MESSERREREIARLRRYQLVHLVTAGLLSLPFMIVLALGTGGPIPVVLVFVSLINLGIADRHQSRIELLMTIEALLDAQRAKAQAGEAAGSGSGP